MVDHYEPSLTHPLFIKNNIDTVCRIYQKEW